MSELNDLYQEVILEHNKNPRNFREIAEADKTATGNNPLCGDALRVYIDMEGDTVKDVSFKGSGCAISKASASMMTQVVKGKTKEEAEVLFDEFHRKGDDHTHWDLAADGYWLKRRVYEYFRRALLGRTTPA